MKVILLLLFVGCFLFVIYIGTKSKRKEQIILTGLPVMENPTSGVMPKCFNKK